MLRIHAKTEQKKTEPSVWTGGQLIYDRLTIPKGQLNSE